MRLRFDLYIVFVITVGYRSIYAHDCQQCHTEAPAHVSATACAHCHENKPPELIRSENHPQIVIPNMHGLPPGMIYPPYAPESRLGDEPSPMVLIPAGSFLRGTNERLADEGPQHTVDLPAFWIDKFEVTNLQYARSLAANFRRPPEHFDDRRVPVGKADHPVTFVSWFDAQAYCQWAGKRLPTDQEWEKAARGTDGRRFPWGNEFELHAANTPARWQSLHQDGDTTPVGAFPAGVSAYGVFDMSGNVWEWTDAWYLAYPNNVRPSENYGEKYRTLKGGSWWDCSFYKCGISAPVYNRAFFSPRVQNASFGFRCAKDAVAGS